MELTAPWGGMGIGKAAHRLVLGLAGVLFYRTTWKGLKGLGRRNSATRVHRPAAGPRQHPRDAAEVKTRDGSGEVKKRMSNAVVEGRASAVQI